MTPNQVAGDETFASFETNVALLYFICPVFLILLESFYSAFRTIGILVVSPFSLIFYAAIFLRIFSQILSSFLRGLFSAFSSILLRFEVVERPGMRQFFISANS